jgi:hypothetical protein
VSVVGSVRATPGRTSLVLVAPHGGRRDPVRRPWGSAPLKMNDLHTAALTQELAAATGAATLVNADLDRNDVDLNRLSAAHDRLPEFLEQLRALVRAALDRHGRATVLTVHGWNVVQPAVDVGLGCTTDGDPFRVGPHAAVSPSFAQGGLAAFHRACVSRGITPTVGARYPARAKENLIQLFTTRHRADPRPLVRELASLGVRCDAMQLELAIPLRWPGDWRRRLVAACIESLPALTGEPGVGLAAAPQAGGADAGTRRSREFVAGDVAGLATLDALGGRLLLFPPEGGLVLFTGERVGPCGDDHVAGLAMTAGAARVRFEGPMVRFADTTPFVDLEHGLGGADVVQHADVDLRFAADDASEPTGFGRVTGAVVLDGRRLDVGGSGFAVEGRVPLVWPRLRVAVRLPDGVAVSVIVGLHDGSVTGFVADASGRHPLATATVDTGDPNTPLEQFALELGTEGGHRLRLRGSSLHRLPVVRGGSAPPVRLLYASLRLHGRPEPVGWCELGGV